MIVRFITKRFIGDYDPKAPKSYTFRYHVDNEDICYEVMDGSGLPEVNSNLNFPQNHSIQNIKIISLQEHEHLLEADLRRADAFIILYSVTDKCSFDDTSRLKFLITYAKRRKKMGKDLTLKVNWN